MSCANTNPKKAGITLVISDKAEFRIREIIGGARHNNKRINCPRSCNK